MNGRAPAKIILFANTDWYLYNFRLSLARALRSRGNEIVLISPRGDYTHEFNKENFRWIEFPFSRSGLNPFKETRTILRLIHLYRNEKPTVALHFTIKCVLYGSLAARFVRGSGVLNVITGLGYAFTGLDQRAKLLRAILPPFYRFFLNSTQSAFQNPDDMELFLSKKLVKTENSTLIKGSGVDTERFKPTSHPPAETVVLFAGRMLHSKGVDEFVKAAQVLRSRGITARFILAGDVDEGNPESLTKEQLLAWQAEGTVEWPGWQKDMLGLFTHAQVVVLPSHDREGVPRTLLEAAACGIPLVGTDVPGIREIVRHGQNGLLVPVGNVPALAQAIQDLLQDPDLRERMGNAGRRIVEQEFSSDLVIPQTITLIDRLMGKS